MDVGRLLLVGLGIVAWAPRLARAEITPRVTRISYRARGAGCPAPFAFLDQIAIRSRGETLQLVDGAEGADYAIELREGDAPPVAASPIETERSLASGLVYVSRQTERSRLKELRGASCSEVASGLALVVSIAIERQRGTASREASAVPAPKAPPGSSGAVPPPNRREPGSAPAPGPQPIPTGPTRAVWSESMGLDATVTSGYVANPSLGAVGFLEIERSVRPPFALVVRLSVTYQEGRMQQVWGSGRATLIAGVIEVCPLRIPVFSYAGEGPGVDLAVCLGGAWGRLATHGEIRGGAGQDDQAFYQDARVSLRPRFALSRWLWTVLDLGARTCFWPYTLTVGGLDQPAFRSQGGAFASVGLAYELP